MHICREIKGAYEFYCFVHTLKLVKMYTFHSKECHFGLSCMYKGSTI